MMYKKYVSKVKQDVVIIFPGEMYVSKSGEVISTVLGSCISVCLFDKVNKVGGMNHFMLPYNPHKEPIRIKLSDTLQPDDFSNRILRYGIYAMEVLIATMQKNGAERKNLTAKIFGGGNVLCITTTTLNVGQRNIEFIDAFLKSEKIPVIRKSTGENYGRRIYFLTSRNSIFLKRIGADQVVPEEQKFLDRLSKDKQKGEIFIF